MGVLCPAVRGRRVNGGLLLYRIIGANRQPARQCEIETMATAPKPALKRDPRDTG